MGKHGNQRMRTKRKIDQLDKEGGINTTDYDKTSHLGQNDYERHRGVFNEYS